MSAADNIKNQASRAAQNLDEGAVSAQLDNLRAELQNLSGTVSRMAGRQINRAQDMAVETAEHTEEAIRRNPLTSVAVAVGLGFLFGLLTRVR